MPRLAVNTDLFFDNLIYLYTVMHSGTIFTLDLLEKHSHYEDALSFPQFYEKGFKAMTPRKGKKGFYILQQHCTLNDFAAYGLTYPKMASFTANAFSRVFRTVSTIRDPLRLLITMRNRLIKEGDNNANLDVFVSNVLYAYMSPGFKFCVDLHITPEARERHVLDLLKYLELPEDRDNKTFWNTVTNWQPLNRFSEKKDHLVEAYDTHNLRYLIRNLPGAKTLIQMQDSFTSVLEPLGYKFWWTETTKCSSLLL